MAVNTVEEIIDDDHAIINTASDPEFYISIMSFINKNLFELGFSALLHHKTQSFIGILQDDTDPLVRLMKLDKVPTESYADIGGLEQQIQEIKVSTHFPWFSLSIITSYSGICWAPSDTSWVVWRDGHQTA